MQVLTIRAATLTDLPDLTRLWHEKMVLQQQFDRRFSLRPDAKTLWTQAVSEWLSDSNCRIEIAHHNDTLTGYAIAWIRPSPPGVFPTHMGFVEEIVVDPHCHQGGVGRQLLDALKVWFFERKIQNVVAYVPRVGAVEQAFWRAQGAVEWVDLMWIK
ncbi:MAG: GNAT family N-acetyltransferase [Chloroflexota bacterium]